MAVTIDTDIRPRFQEDKLGQYRDFIRERRQIGTPAKVFRPDASNAGEIASLMAAGGIVAMPWGAEERRIMILACCFDNQEGTAALNELKGRPSRQVLGIGSISESVHEIAETEQSKPLVNAARRLIGVDQPSVHDLNKVLAQLYRDNSVGVLLRARDTLPEQVTASTAAGRTVLVLGAISERDPNDIYNYTLHELANRYGKGLAGTSANPHGKTVYSVVNQEQLYNEIGNKVDGFVMFDPIPPKSPKDNTSASSTALDLTGDVPKVMRWGSQHPRTFRKVFSDLVVPKDVTREKHAEGFVDYLKRNFLK